MNYSESKITAVLGLYKNLELSVEFLNDFHTRFPGVLVSVGILGNSKIYQESLLKFYEGQSWITIAAGKEDQRVSFSENWNAAIKNITTERFVFLHNDMYIHKEFFENLKIQMDVCGPQFFYLYTTVEPLENAGFVRPGKVVAPFGHSLEDFEEEKFNAFAKKYINSHLKHTVNGYGFYLAGFTKSLQNVGGFDSVHFNPYFCEDDDINVRIRIKGYHILIAHQALVYHFGSKTIRLETQSSMSGVEIESNRQFARKWGFEARYLWNTGYEKMPEIHIGKEYLMFESPAHRGIGPELEKIDILNVEPVVDGILLTPGEIEKSKDYFQQQGLESKLFSDECPEPDILICPTQGHDFFKFAELVGNLRFYHEHLGLGEGQAGNYLVTVLHTGEDRVDTTNYLSESVTNE